MNEHKELFELMGDLSERCYCASWLTNWGATIWKLINSEIKDCDVGQNTIKAWELLRIKQLVESTEGIWEFIGDGNNKTEYWGMAFIPLDEWKEYYKINFECDKK